MSTAPLPWEKYASSAAPPAGGPWEKYAEPAVKQPQAEPEEKSPEPSFLNTLGREAKSAVGTIAGIPGGIYHSFSDAPSAEEQKEFSTDAHPGLIKRGAIGLTRMTAEPIANAAVWYARAAQGKIPNPVEQALSVAPEAMGQAAGNVIAGKGAESAFDTARNMSVTKATAPVRSIAKGTNVVLKKAPDAVGAAAGTVVGREFGHPGYGAMVGGYLGRRFLPRIQVPGENFGLPDRVIGGPVSAPKYIEPKPVYPGAPLPENPGVFPGAHLPEDPGVFPGAPLPENPGVFPGAHLPEDPGVFPGAPLPEHPGVFLGAPLPASPAPEQLNPSLVSESRTLPGQIGKEVIRTPIARPQPIPARSGLMLKSGPAEEPVSAPTRIARPNDDILNRLSAIASNLPKEQPEAPAIPSGRPLYINGKPVSPDIDLTAAGKASLRKIARAKKSAPARSETIQ